MRERDREGRRDTGSREKGVWGLVVELGAPERLGREGLHTHVSGCQLRDTCLFLTLGLGLGSTRGTGVRHCGGPAHFSGGQLWTLQEASETARD